MKNKKLCITLDLESTYGELIEESYDGCEISLLEPFLKIIKSYEIKLTVFVVGKLIEMKLPILYKLRDFGAEFALHSYSHDLKKADDLEEIIKGKNAYYDFFGCWPKGYRAPRGLISDLGYKNLRDQGFIYDSSIFPSFWPNIKYLKYDRQPNVNETTNIIELPIATIPYCRIIISLSWIKLFGWPIYSILLRNLSCPDVLIFDSHLHDYIPVKDCMKKLPIFWRIVHSRNTHNGIQFFVRFINLMLSKGYEFSFISDIIANM